VPTRKEILKILTIVKKTCGSSGCWGAPEQGAPEQGAPEQGDHFVRVAGERGDG